MTPAEADKMPDPEFVFQSETFMAGILSRGGLGFYTVFQDRREKECAKLMEEVVDRLNSHASLVSQVAQLRERETTLLESVGYLLATLKDHPGCDEHCRVCRAMEKVEAAIAKCEGGTRG